MNEDIKNFSIKVGVAVVAILVIYYFASPYQSCMREWDSAIICGEFHSW